ncbi:MAG: holo-ACP synthase [Defluviitaleaceae bacterium]|nr:holo-ACP synthase [Defluviitaleaceae bacterium]
MTGIGVDIVEFNRIKAMVKKEKFIDKVLSNKEKEVYLTLASEKRQLEYLAGRWAIKEAIYKAAPALCQGKNFIDFSILNDVSGAPYLDEPRVATFMMTLSHSENYAVAFVVFVSSFCNNDE